MEIKKNLPFIIGISLPILMILVVASTIYIPTWFEKKPAVEEQKSREIVSKQTDVSTNAVIPSITVKSPGEGEVLYNPNGYKISWDYQGDIYSKVNILVKQYDEAGDQIGGWYIIAKNIPLSQKYYHWNPLDDNLYSTTSDDRIDPFGYGRFKIKIMEVSGNIFATSGIFIINDEVSNVEDYCKNITGGEISVENGRKYCVWEKKVFEGGCGGSDGEGGEYCDEAGSGTKVLNLPAGFSNPTIEYLTVDDSGEILINGTSVYSTGPGCYREINLNKDISSYVHTGENNITANVNNDCGLSMSSKVRIKFRIDYKSSSIPTLTMVFPNGGESLQIGKTYQIVWSLEGFDSWRDEDSGIQLQLWDDSKKNYIDFIANGSGTKDGGTYNWKIDGVQPGVYTIRGSVVSTNVRLPSGYYTLDYTDKSFTITH